MQQSRFSKVTAQILVIGISLAFIINFGPQAGTACAADRPGRPPMARRSAQASTIAFTGNASARGEPA